MIDNDIIQTIYKFANSFDLKDWEALRSTLDNEIICDYLDLRGSIDTLSSEAYIKKRIEALESLLTQHLFANPELAKEENSAYCRVSAIIFRNKNGVIFNTHAIYSFKLRLIDDHWRIFYIKQKVLWNDGDPNIHSGAKKAS
jgi:hypothetical protein